MPRLRRGRWSGRVVVEFHLECPASCSLKEGTRWGGVVTEGLVTGKTVRSIAAEVAKLGGTVALGSMTRHRRHIVVHDNAPKDDAPAKATNIEILETIIQKGFSNSKNWKPTISDTMKAMDMWFKLTQGNPFDELLDTLAAASMQDENPAAEGVPAEQEDVVDAEG